MSNWNDVLEEIRSAESPFDIKRKEYLAALHEQTGRNTVAYYSGWLQKPGLPMNAVAIHDNDKNGFMNAFSGLDFNKGLDLILHTPGGDVAATESIIDYLREKFNDDIRVVIPQLAMSGGTMIACAAKKIVMGKHSSLGPIDPQMNGVPAHGVVEEFQKASDDIGKNPHNIPLWQVLLSKYPIAMVGESEKAIAWAEEIAKNSLKKAMFKDEFEENEGEVNEKIESIIEGLGHAATKSHSRHLSAQTCSDLGLKIEILEDDQDLQDAVLSVHHVFTHTFSGTPAAKIIANHTGKAFIQNISSQEK